MRVWQFRLAVTLVLAVAAAIAAVPAAAHPTLEVNNPSPNDRLTPGALVMHGAAFDRDATQGSGVDQVLVFLGSREHGGQLLGQARLGMPNPMPIFPLQFTSSGWMVRTQSIKGAGEQRTLFVYAHSTVTDTETMIKIPVIVGHQPPPPGPTVTEDSGTPPAGPTVTPGSGTPPPSPTVTPGSGTPGPPPAPPDEGGPEE